MPKRESRERATTPEDYPVPPSFHLPSGDYSYTVELVGTIQNSLGQLTEAVEGLKRQSKDHGDELKRISQDIHTAKITARIVGAILVAAIGFGGSAINKGVDTFMQMRQAPAAVQSSQPPQ